MSDEAADSWRIRPSRAAPDRGTTVAAPGDVTSLNSFLEHIRRGASLAAPVLLLACSSDGGTTGPSGGSGGVIAGAGGSGGAGGSTALPPLPDEAPAACTGESHDASFGYHGACCEHLICRPKQADGTCPGDGNTYGSGMCACGASGAGGGYGNVKGPFAPDPKRDAGMPGDCCYLSTYIGCDGRPLHVAEDTRLAPAVRRPDWC